MRSLFVISILFITLGACTSKAEKKKENKLKKEILFGSFNDGIYINPFFNLNIVFDENWEVDTKAFQSVMFGGELFEAEYLNSHKQEYPIKVILDTEKANPFGSKSPIEKLKESQEGYEMFISDEDLKVSQFDKVTIAGKDFAHAEFIAIDDFDTTYVNECYYYQNGFFLSVIYSYSCKEDEKMATDFISSIKKNK